MENKFNNEQKIKCPFCEKEILAIAKKCKYCGKWLKFKCPFCAEEISSDTTKCPHCGEVVFPTPEAFLKSVMEESTPVSSKEIFIIIFYVLVFLFIIFQIGIKIYTLFVK